MRAAWVRSKKLFALPKLRRKGFFRWLAFHWLRASGCDRYRQGGWAGFFGERSPWRRVEESASFVAFMLSLTFGWVFVVLVVAVLLKLLGF